jgi:thioredoxin-related protein
MRITCGILLLLLVSFTACKAQNDYCERISNKPLSFLTDTSRDTRLRSQRISEDIAIIHRCAQLDSIDQFFFGAPLIGMLLVSNAQKLREPTYGDVIHLVDSVRHTAFYKSVRDSFISYKPSISELQRDVYTAKARPALASYPFKSFKSLEDCIHRAQSTHKRVLLYFTGWANVNGRKMEQLVFADQRVKDVLQDRYEAYILFADSDEKMPGSDQTIGDYVITLQQQRFHTDYQPYLVILDERGKTLRDVGYLSRPEQFLDLLK